MKSRIIHQCFLVLLLVTTSFVRAQEPAPFWNEIQGFKKADSLHNPVKNAILFVGSSSFRMWKDVDKAFPNHTIINRGFGGSSLPHVIQYANEIIFPYKPKQIVIYCGENDMTAEGVTGDTVFQRFKTLFTLIRNRLKNVPVVFVSMKPSPSRWHLKEKMERGNALIKEFLATEKKTAFVDVWMPMLTEDGKPREELFLADRLHMNEKGYAIWTEKIAPHLVKK
ncbi:MAG: G-D-S-L family lipolytic protein [Chitinophagaceae bacterium]|nr:MAG: G-D-S-L family lipolytic protein [Chitinophagaceae bacterium]